jgi:hypothetical protein
MAFGKKPATKHDDDEPAPVARPITKSSDIPLMREAEVPAELPPTEIQLLADVVVAAIRVPQFDDMPWPEIDAALELASHKIKLVFVQHGTLDPSPGDNLP